MALTKTLKFDNDVLNIIKGMEWSDDGLLGKMTCGQLDRQMYEKVNKALDAMGGKWNRKSGGHVFKTDPRPSVDGLLENGALTVERDGFFETPRKVVERMLELVELDSDTRVLEPSAGMGAIVDVIKHEGDGRGVEIWLVEKNADRALYLTVEYDHVICDNFLTWEPTFLEFDKFDRVYMNPPFEEMQDIDHVMHAYDLLKPGGRMVSVMSNSPFFRSDKKAVEFRNWLTRKGGYSEPLPEGSFKESGTGVNTVLVVLSKPGDLL